MPNTALNRTTIAQLTNKSGGDLTQGTIVVIDRDNNKSFETTTVSGYTASNVGVIVEPAGITNNSIGAVALAGWVPQINVTATAAGQYVRTSSDAGDGYVFNSAGAGDFATVLETGANPEAFLFGTTITSAVGGTGTDEKVKVTSADTTGDYLSNKVTLASGISTRVLNAGGNEDLVIPTHYISSVTTVTANNSSSDFTFFEFRIPANTLTGTSGMIEFHAEGQIQNVTGADATGNFIMYRNSNSINSCSFTIAMASSSTNHNWFLDGIVSGDSLDQMVVTDRFFCQKTDIVASGWANQGSYIYTGTQALASSIFASDLTIKLVFNWTAADANLTATCKRFYVRGPYF